MVLTFIVESFLPSFLNSRVTLFDTECRIIRQANKAITSVAASNTKGNKLKDIHPDDRDLSMVPWTDY
jgi:hypothetical protein